MLFILPCLGCLLVPSLRVLGFYRPVDSIRRNLSVVSQELEIRTNNLLLCLYCNTCFPSLYLSLFSLIQWLYCSVNVNAFFVPGTVMSYIPPNAPRLPPADDSSLRWEAGVFLESVACCPFDFERCAISTILFHHLQLKHLEHLVLNCFPSTVGHLSYSCPLLAFNDCSFHSCMRKVLMQRCAFVALPKTSVF